MGNAAHYIRGTQSSFLKNEMYASQRDHTTSWKIHVPHFRIVKKVIPVLCNLLPFEEIHTQFSEGLKWLNFYCRTSTFVSLSKGTSLPNVMCTHPKHVLDWVCTPDGRPTAKKLKLSVNRGGRISYVLAKIVIFTVYLRAAGSEGLESWSLGPSFYIQGLRFWS